MNGGPYCGGCGEDWAIFFHNCDRCGDEYCDCCASDEAHMAGLCDACLDKANAEEAEAKRLASLVPATKVLPCMRDWYQTHVIGGRA